MLSLEEFSRGAALAAQLDARGDPARDARVPALAQAAGRGRGRRAVPRVPARPGVGVRAVARSRPSCASTRTDFRVSFIGHSHVALSFDRPEGEPATGTTRREGAEVDLATGEWLINPGSVGQPRDGDPRAAWLVLDTERLDRDVAARRVRHRGRPGGDPRGATCRTRSPSGCNTVSDRWAGR